MKLSFVVIPGLCRIGTGFFLLKLSGTPEAALQSLENAAIFLNVIFGHSAAVLS
jgi:hypothetical protein